MSRLCILQGRNWGRGKSSLTNGQQETSLQSQAHQQQVAHQALAHSRARFLHLQGQQLPPHRLKLDDALIYLDQVKVKLSGQPHIYNSFLDIMKEFRSHHVNIPAVIQRVSNLFKNFPELLTGFSAFLPPGFKTEIFVNSDDNSYNVGDVTPSLPYTCLPTTLNNTASSTPENGVTSDNQVKENESVSGDCEVPSVNSETGEENIKPLPVHHIPPDMLLPSKRMKLSKIEDPSLARVGKYGTLNEFAFFDKVRKALRFQEVYDNFLRCLMMFNQEIISRVELIQLVTPFLGKSPELFKWFKDFLKYDESGNNLEIIPCKVTSQEQKKISGDVAMEIDYSSCRRYGVSYRALPKNYLHPKCSGRTSLCKEVLNDVWVSFPSWSEDSTFGSTCKTQFEEIIYRCEDERFELDIVIEANLCTIRALENVQKLMAKMTPEERADFHLDSTLGGTSTVIHQRAITRIYGDKATDIIEGLKKNPVVAVPLVLRRLKAKEEEWREAQKNYNQIWREQIEKYYLKSLDHQGVSFKQNDVKFLRSKSLLNEIETVYEERHEQMDEGSFEVPNGPHMTLVYMEKCVFKDAADLIMYQVKKQPGIHKEDRQKIRNILFGFIPDFFCLPYGQMLEEVEKDEEMVTEEVSATVVANESENPVPMTTDGSSPTPPDNSDPEKPNSENIVENISEEGIVNDDNESVTHFEKNSPVKDSSAQCQKVKRLDLPHSLFFANTTWYLFFRLHHILCERLSKMWVKSRILMAEKEKERKEVKDESVVDYYIIFLETVKKLLDGTMDCNQFEDYLRAIFGIDAYISFTLDRVLQNAMRQLQHLVSEEFSVQCTQMYSWHKQKISGETLSGLDIITAEHIYRRRMEQKLTDENCFRTILYKKYNRMTIKLLDSEPEVVEDPAEVEKWSHYVDSYVAGEESVCDDVRELLADSKKLFLKRNLPPFYLKQEERLQEMQCQEKESENEDFVENIDTRNGEESGCEEDCDNNNKDCENSMTGNTEEVTKDADNADQNNSTDNKETENSENVSEVSKDNIDADATIATGNCDNLEDESCSGGVPGPESSYSPSVKDDCPFVKDDNTQCRFIGNSYKMSFVVFTGSSLFRYNSLERARQTHYKVSRKMSRKFSAWHSLWVEKYVTPGMLKSCQDWMMRSDSSKYRVVCTSENCSSKPPYSPYTRYRLVYPKKV